MSAIKRESKPTKTQLAHDELIKRGRAVRYVHAYLKDDGVGEDIDEGPFPSSGESWAKAPPSPGRQRLLALYRKTDAGVPLAVPVEAHVSDGVGGIKVVTGRDIPAIWDRDIGRQMPLPKKDVEWTEAHEQALSERKARKEQGRRLLGTAVEKLGNDKAAAVEKAPRAAKPVGGEA